MIILDKPEGLTPLQALDRLREKRPEYRDAILSYAGRLDPMASGVLPVLVGEENKRREEFLGLEKEYEFEVLFGIGTDTHDILGIIDTIQPGKPREGAHDLTGTFMQTYPAYSSKPVSGVPLYKHARNGTLDTVKIPSREVTIHSARKVSSFQITGKELLASVVKRVGNVVGDFRQEEILKKWEQSLRTQQERIFYATKYNAVVSSGTYIRTLAREIGEKAGLPALAFSIRRTRVGAMTLKDSVS